ncbi:MAG TPA: exodeoxyribonuclease VII large subunit, partial [Chthoniobacteraceae bacterium]|nr:exodeoxyribonuclease VII large subunit [Chthoniobacteraceae bacterium]
AGEIARAVIEFNDCDTGRMAGVPKPDVIVVCRGGGSIEDLWAFNEEAVARAIFASEIPVVSAVGHEIDFTIADFTADLRAPTPSAAAELVAPDAETLMRHLGQAWSRAGRALGSELARQQERLAFLRRGALFREPAARLEEWGQRVDSCGESLLRATESGLAEAMQRLAALSGALREHRPDQVARLKRQQIEVLAARMNERVAAQLQLRLHQLRRAESLLAVLAPEATLRRGYTITTDAEGKVIRSAKAVRKGTKIHTRFSDGNAVSKVE